MNSDELVIIIGLIGSQGARCPMVELSRVFTL